MKLLLSKIGDKARRAIIGDEWVDKAMKNMTEFDAALHMYTVNTSWAGTWSRNVITPQQFSLINLAMLAAGGHMEQFENHFRGALLNTKVPLDQLRELLLHIGQYCGIPTGSRIFGIARRILAEEKIDLGTLSPLDTSPLYTLGEQ